MLEAMPARSVRSSGLVPRSYHLTLVQPKLCPPESFRSDWRKNHRHDQNASYARIKMPHTHERPSSRLFLAVGL